MNCPNCNSEIPQGASFCIKCGCKAPVVPAKKKSKAGLIIGIVLGALVLFAAIIVGLVFLVKKMNDMLPVQANLDETTTQETTAG